MKTKYLAACIALAHAPNVLAETSLPTIEVTAEEQTRSLLESLTLSEEEIARLRPRSSDTARLLESLPGVNLYGAGGVSSLPVIHGLADDRLRIQVDGMSLISACGNHMNPPLSYIDPANLGGVKVFAGITPVSVGGDSIGSTIQVTSPAPEFAAPGETHLLKGQVSLFYRSNGNARGGSTSLTMANEKLSMTYTGSTAESDNYEAADSFKSSIPATQTAGSVSTPDANEVGSSLYQSRNHALRFALRHENHLVELKLGLQEIPYQGFPNQRMDMTDNSSKHINLSYKGRYQWGALETRIYREKTRHKMNLLPEKLQTSNLAGMPMDTEGETIGALAKADILLSDRDILRVGTEYQRYRLDDWWDPIGPWVSGPVAGKGMRGDSPFWNINNGKRDRFDLFAEWERVWNTQWLSQIGIRSSTVKMDTGDIRGYNTVAETIQGGYGDPTDPTTIPGAFNARNHKKSDHNIDLTALARYRWDAEKSIEAGYSRKVRSPNLYERYSWSTTNKMIMNMINFSGEANGYVGNLDLEPEVAHTLSATFRWRDAANDDWGLQITPYFTYIEDYIDAKRCTGSTTASNPCTTANAEATTGFVYLQYDNQSARIYGADISGHLPVARSERYGRITASAQLSITKGENRETGDGLYNMMPLNATLALTQHRRGWTNTIEWQLVAGKKDDLSKVRNELETDGYGLLNIRSSHQWKYTRLDMGIDNLLDKFYEHPLGGAYVGEGNVMGGGATWGVPVPGMGRSLYAGITITF